MEKIRNSSSYTGTVIAQTDTSKVEKGKENISSSTVEEKTQSFDKGSYEGAKSREKETGLQASLRKQTLLTEAEKCETKTGATSIAKKERVPFSYKSEAELRDLVSKKAFPAVKDAMEKNHLTCNGPNCNIASGMMKNALENMGVAGVEIKDTHSHAYLEVKTNDGKSIIIDPTISQFFKDGSAIDSQLHHKGFIGTKEELKQLIRNNIDQWIQHGPDWPAPDPQAVDAYKGKNVPGITREMAADILSTNFERAESRYFSDVTTYVGDAARKQAEWYSKGNLDEPLDLPNGIWGHGNSAPHLKKLYQAMEENLREK